MANEHEIERWNGDTARRWLAERARHAAVRDRLIPHLLDAAAVAPGDRVLDVGCGCGDTARALARSAGTVVGLDVSEPLLTVARREVPGVRFVRGDAQVHPLPPAGFDVVVSSFGVLFFDDPVAAFGNLRAAVRPGGRLAFLSWQDPLANEVFAIPLRVFQGYGYELPGGDGDPLADPERITAILTGAGFGAVRVRPVAEPARLGTDVADVLAYVTGTTRVGELFAAAGDGRAGPIRAAIQRELAARQRAGGVWVRAAAYLVTATAAG
ncbi:class I SAM-dependent methyltransferase [Actinoplanes flavus]|uniref:Methyltransferase domain-containing protein n=1 Tax=Actinoplanes flavus TaxID=2820290 RepID=A0ABS3UY01_9ACTN|nr:methyltransferase domain-containing protein [Actinoplanes flavus]MBO3743468.1 methyltransferase domain-containing protein [Actinoplanes flavus]